MVISFLAGVKYHEKIFFSALGMNGLFSYNVNREEVEFLGFFEKESFALHLHNKAFLYKNEMWIMPMEANNIACVNLDTIEITYYQIPEREKNQNINAFYDGIVDGKILYFLPYHIDSFVMIDMEEHNVRTICHKKINALTKQGMGVCLYAGKLLTMTSDGNIGARIDIKSGQVESLRQSISDADAYYSGIQIKDEIWAIPSHGSSVKRINIKEGKENNVLLPDKDDLFFRGMDLGKYVLLFPLAWSRNFALIEKNTNEIAVLNNEINRNEKLFAKSPSLLMERIDSVGDYWATSNTGSIFQFSENGEIINNYQITVEGSTEKRIKELLPAKKNYEELFDICNIVEECEPLIGLDSFLRFICEEKQDEKN